MHMFVSSVMLFCLKYICTQLITIIIVCSYIHTYIYIGFLRMFCRWNGWYQCWQWTNYRYVLLLYEFLKLNDVGVDHEFYYSYIQYVLNHCSLHTYTYALYVTMYRWVSLIYMWCSAVEPIHAVASCCCKDGCA